MDAMTPEELADLLVEARARDDSEHKGGRILALALQFMRVFPEARTEES